MRKYIVGAFAVAAICVSGSAMADDFHAGAAASFGVPGGVDAGVVVNPWVDWARVQLSLGYNYLSFGGQAGLQIDPLAAVFPKLPIGLFADVQGGFFPVAGIPGQPSLPNVGYNYANFYGGLRLGTGRGFSWLIEAGPSYIDIHTSNFQAIANKLNANGLTLGNASATGWFIPTAETGFQIVF